MLGQSLDNLYIPICLNLNKNHLFILRPVICLYIPICLNLNAFAQFLSFDDENLYIPICLNLNGILSQI